jgi:plastocyanin
MPSRSRRAWARKVDERARGVARQGWRLAVAGVAAACVPSPLPAVAADPPARTHVVVIEGMRFVPDTLVARRGDRIVWRNKDLVPHTATAAKVFDSGNIASSASWTHVARDAGTFPYVCTFHPTMTGTLRVE